MKPKLSKLSDKELVDELLARCLKRLDEPITATSDEKLRNLLFDAGKLLLDRFPRPRTAGEEMFGEYL